MIEELLSLENCHVVDTLPEVLLVVSYDKLPPIKNRKVGYSRSIFTTKGGEVRIVITFHPEWGSPIREVYLRKDKWDYIEKNARMIIEAYKTKMRDKSQWDILLR